MSDPKHPLFSGALAMLQTCAHCFAAGRQTPIILAVLCLIGLPSNAISQNLAPGAALDSTPAFHPDRILIMPRADTSQESLASFHTTQQTRVLRNFPRVGNLQVVQLPEGESVPVAVARYQQSGLVEFAEPDYRVSAAATIPDDPQYLDGTLWGLNNSGQNSGVADADLDAPEAWDLLRSASNVIVAIVDSGVRYTHEDLATNLWRNPLDGSHGLNALTGTTNVWDDFGSGHGTHLAGIIGAAGNNGKGVTGLAWRAQIMVCKFLDSQGDGSNSDAVTCIEYARSNGATVINLSWGGNAFSAAVSNAIRSAQSDGILFAAAAGNGNGGIPYNTDFTPYFPASLNLPNLISVGASTRQDSLWSSSNYGANSVDLFAPGASIFSTTATGDGTYGNMNGTSMATAYVTGALALLRQQSPSASFGALAGRLLSTVDRRPAFAGKCVTGGRLNLLKALGPPVRLTVLEAPANGAYQFRVDGGPDRTCIIEASSNLTSWMPVFTNTTSGAGWFDFTDALSTNLPCRFYRGIAGP